MDSPSISVFHDTRYHMRAASMLPGGRPLMDHGVCAGKENTLLCTGQPAMLSAPQSMADRLIYEVRANVDTASAARDRCYAPGSYYDINPLGCFVLDMLYRSSPYIRPVVTARHRLSSSLQ